MNSAPHVIRCVVDKLDSEERRLVARGSIEPGDIVISESPVVVAPGFLEASYRAWEIVRAVLSGSEKLKWFLNVGYKWTQQPWDDEDVRVAQAIVKDEGVDLNMVQQIYFKVATNHLGFFDAGGCFAGSGLYETLCFSNHSCSPNTEPAALETRVPGAALRAIEFIADGEEITWNYLWPRNIAVLGRKRRQKKLYEEFRFRCLCRRCASGR